MNDNYKAVFINLIKNPRKAFYDITQYNLYKYKLPLLMLAGITSMVNKKLLSLADRHENYPYILITTIGMGILVGWFGIFLFSWLISVVGKWFKGHASFTVIFGVAAYATLPIVVMLLSNFICIAILRSRGFALSYSDVGLIDAGNINQIVLNVNRYISWAMNLYYLVLFVIGISVVQRFTIGKAVLNLFVVLLTAVLLLGVFISLTFLMNRFYT